MPVVHINPWNEEIDRAEVQMRIKQYKRKLKARARKKGLYENFGEKECRALTDEFGVVHSDPAIRTMIEGFYDWCWDYTG